MVKRDLNLAIAIATRYIGKWGRPFLNLCHAAMLEDLSDYPTFGRWMKARMRIKRQMEETDHKEQEKAPENNGPIFGIATGQTDKFGMEVVKWLNKPERSDKGRLPFDSRYAKAVSESGLANQANRDSRRLSE